MKITKEEINELPLISFEGKIEVITDKESCLKACEILKKEKLLGFDTETRPAFKKGQNYSISLLQLSTEDTCYLFRLNYIHLFDEIKEILEDESIVKAGVAVHDDIKGLNKISPYKPAGFVELADLAKKKGISQLGLRSICAIILGKRLSKKNKLTNWENPDLTGGQLRYAATDAWLGLKLYNELK